MKSTTRVARALFTKQGELQFSPPKNYSVPNATKQKSNSAAHPRHTDSDIRIEHMYLWRKELAAPKCRHPPPFACTTPGDFNPEINRSSFPLRLALNLEAT